MTEYDARDVVNKMLFLMPFFLHFISSFPAYYLHKSSETILLSDTKRNLQVMLSWQTTP